MPLAFANVQTTADPLTTPAALAGLVDDSNGGFAVVSAPCLAQLQYGGQGSSDWGAQFEVPAGGMDIDPDATGIRFFTNPGGLPAICSAAIFRKDEPALRLSGLGSVTVQGVTVTYQHNAVTQGAESILDFEDSAGADESIAWTLTDTPGTKMAVSAALTFHAANKDSAASQVFTGTIQTPAIGVNTAPPATGGIALSGRVFSGAPATGGIWVDGGNQQFFGSTDGTHIGIYNTGWWLTIDQSGNTQIQGTFGWKTGVGNGASYTQLTSLTTSVAVTTIVGQINTFTSALAGGLNVVFTVTTSAGLVTSTDQVIVSWSNNPWSGNIPIWVTGIFGNSFQIAYTNLGALTSSQTGRINYTIIKGGGANN